MKEKINFLYKCIKNKRFKDGMDVLINSFINQLYQFKKRFHHKNPKPFRFYNQEKKNGLPRLTKTINDLFVKNISLASLKNSNDVFHEADLQLMGTYRLAGGYYFNGIKRGAAPDLDEEEHQHSYHRLYWASRYALATCLGHKGAKSGLLVDLKLWLGQNWSNDPIYHYPYTTSERIASLVEVLFWIKHGNMHLLNELIIEIKQQIVIDARHLFVNVEYFLGPHNHILNDARALYLASVILSELPEAKNWQELSFKLWEKYFPILILKDGSLAEGTSFYHVMICRTVIEYYLATKKHNRKIPEGFKDRINKMFILANDFLREDGSMPRFGNSSPDHSIQDLWGLLAVAHYFGLISSSPGHQAITPLTIYYCGMISKLEPVGESSSIKLYPDGGWAFSKNAKLKVELAINGEVSPKTRCHGDCGRGSYELWWDGDVIIREPGNFSYKHERRHWYRSGEGQNVTVINGIPPGISAEYQAEFPDWYLAYQSGDWKLEGKRIFYLTNGFQRLPNPVKCERQWYWRTEDCLVMEERLNGIGRLNFKSYLHFGDANWQQKTPTMYSYSKNDILNRQCQMTLDLPAGIKPSIIKTQYSPEFGIEQPGETLLIKGKVFDLLKWSVVWEFSESG